MYRKLLLTALLLLFIQTIFPQISAPKIEIKSETEISAELKKQAIEFLRESAGEVGNLRTLENRISFASEMANLMWFHDEKEARKMMNAVVGDFKQLLSQYDAQINASGIELGESELHPGGFLGSVDQSENTRLMRKLAKAMTARQQIALSIAEHDPQFALEFYNNSLQLFTNAQVRARFEAPDVYFELRLVNQIIEKDAGKALELARKSLAVNLTHEHIELLKKIYEKDAEKGAAFAGEIIGKLKGVVGREDDFYIIGATFKLGAENFEKAKKDNKKPMFSEQNLRDLADLTAQEVLKRFDYGEIGISEYYTLIEKYAPSRGVQIRAKKASMPKGANVRGVSVEVEADQELLMSKASEEKDEREEVLKGLQELDKKQLPKEEREKVIGQARKIIAATPNRQQKIAALSALAAQVSKLGDKELASEIMKDAQGLVNASPKTYLDFMEIWMLMNGLAETNPEKAFPLFEDTISRLNETIGAFIKVGEFMDVSGEMVDDGEVQVGSFSGSMVKELTGGLGGTDTTIFNLAKSDFSKPKTLTNRFDRQEVRILAKMLVLRSILGEKKKPSEEK